MKDERRLHQFFSLLQVMRKFSKIVASEKKYVHKMLSSNASYNLITNLETQFDFICIIVLLLSIIGVMGNILTVIAFQYAKIKKKYRFHKTWNHITVFIWNLALIDSLSAVNMTLIYSLFVFYPKGINISALCIPIVILRDIFVLISASSIACISIVTLIGVTKNPMWKNFCDKSSNVTGIIVLAWVIGFAGYIAKLVKIAEILHNYDFEHTFDCGTFFHSVNLSHVTLWSEFSLHFFVLISIFLSYGIITVHTHRVNESVDSQREGTHPRDTGTTKVVLIVCITYVIQFIPYMVCRLFFDGSLRIGFFIQFQWPQKISYLIYYTQYVPNIFIYVTRNRSYRNAYIYWIKNVFCCFSNNDVEVNGRDNSNSLRNDHRSQRNNFPLR